MVNVWLSPGISASREPMRISWPPSLLRMLECASVNQSMGSNATAMPLWPSQAQVSGVTAEPPWKEST